HPRNEDAMALATAEQGGHPVALAVVCDGVSSSRRPDEASLAAVQAAVRVLLAGVREDADLPETSLAAVAAAQQALAGLDEPGPGDPPSATFVSAVLTHQTATLCWLGDSRAYWLGSGPGSEAKRLTSDDSLAGEMVAAGLVFEADAMALPGAHVVTGWLGADASGTEPHVATFTPPGPGVLLLCSDGLWNYRPGAAELAELALPGALTDPLDTAAALVSFALGAGASASSSSAPSAGVAPAPAAVPGEPCPQCGAARTGQFCEVCGFNFASGTAPAAAGSPGPGPVAPAVVNGGQAAGPGAGPGPGPG